MSSRFDEVRSFVARSVGVKEQAIGPGTTLFGDLGVDGDDAVELFLEFARKFQVDLSELVLTRHFGPEGSVLFSWIGYCLRRGSPETRARLEPITIANLAEAASVNRWRYPAER